MAVTLDDVRHIAALARLGLDDERAARARRRAEHDPRAHGRALAGRHVAASTLRRIGASRDCRCVRTPVRRSPLERAREAFRAGHARRILPRAAALDARRAGGGVVTSPTSLSAAELRDSIVRGDETAASRRREPDARRGRRGSRRAEHSAASGRRCVASRRPRARRPIAGERGAAARRAGRRQGQHRHDVAADVVRLADSRGLRQSVRGDRGAPASRGRRDRRRARRTWTSSRWARRPRTARTVRRGIRSRRSRAGRIVGRLGGGGRGGHRAHRARIGDRRLGATAGGVLRHRRREADVRSRESVRARRLRVVARSHRRVRSNGRRRRARSRGHRRRRSARLDERRRSPSRDYRDAARGGLTGVVIGRPERILPGRSRSAHSREVRRALDELQAPRRRGARRVAAAHALGDRGLLHHRAGRSVVEPRALRRCAVRACASRATDCAACTKRRARAASVPRSRVAFCSARTCCRPATTTRTTERRSRCAR